MAGLRPYSLLDDWDLRRITKTKRVMSHKMIVDLKDAKLLYTTSV